jgi:hypothetical protein
MTATLKRTVYDDPVESELARWPGVTYRREQRGKHNALVLSYRGATRFVIYAATPGDTRRGALNHLADVRAELRVLGAVRTVQAKAEGRRRRKPTGQVVSIYEFDRANPEGGPLRDPFAVLAGLKVAERAPPAEAVEPVVRRPSLWSRIAAFVRRVVG